MTNEPAREPAIHLDHYRLERRLALGGMAEVFLAVDEKSHRQVAIKRILPQVATDKDFLDRFFHEIQIQISLKHKNVVELLDCSPAPGNAYIVMEYVDGGSLEGLREEVGSLPWELALYVVAEALQGLSVAHRKGITHRDVKPHNVMWTTEGEVKIADFGISQAANLTRLTMTGTVVGTPAHMSPEQARGETLDARSDLFSMGTVLYELVTGVNPFAAESITATLRRVVEVDPEPPSLLDPTIPPGIDLILRRLHAKDRNLRYKTADEAVGEIRQLLQQEGFFQIAGIFRAFLGEPARFISERKSRLARESAGEARRLLDDRDAPPEQALWEAYRTLSCTPDDTSAQTLFRLASEKAGQREKPVDNPKIRELEAQLRRDPGNVGILLQLAKLYRLEHDFIHVMKFFRKLQALSPGDAYTQGQIAALVRGNVFHEGDPASTARKKGTPAARDTELRSSAFASGPDAGTPPNRMGIVGVVVAAVALAGAGAWWAARHPGNLPAGSEADRERFRKMADLLKGKADMPPPEPRSPRQSPDDALQKILEKGALLEKDAGAARALAFYREKLLEAKEPGVRAPILLTISELSFKSGDRSSGHQALDEVIALGEEHRSAAILRKADALEHEKEDGAARRLYEELLSGNDSDARRHAKLRLALQADRGGDPARALALYEEILARDPDSPESNPARMGAAALYRAAGRKADARHSYEEVKRRSPPGSDFERSADAGLQSLE